MDEWDMNMIIPTDSMNEEYLHLIRWVASGEKVQPVSGMSECRHDFLCGWLAYLLFLETSIAGIFWKSSSFPIVGTTIAGRVRSRFLP
ncbi:hypothetical protein [Paraburkholderia kururiensis]|uniref:hypothetical protein n=1 Tax=Paraburkholderia kururiensis TaxID=984307 RepID=UPI000F864875|nr:hypothetical protein [Paraburkholderia kururiensis]